MTTLFVVILNEVKDPKRDCLSNRSSARMFALLGIPPTGRMTTSLRTHCFLPSPEIGELRRTSPTGLDFRVDNENDRLSRYKGSF